VDSRGRTIWIADAHRDDGKRYVVRADEKLTAFVELESAISMIALKEQRRHNLMFALVIYSLPRMVANMHEPERTKATVVTSTPCQ